jgi:uncharacterized protein YecT (DUF1311 family)
MLKFIIFFSLAMAKTTHASWEGTYNLEEGDTSSEVIISGCSEHVCKFSISSATGSHSCDVDGKITIDSDDISATQNVDPQDKDTCLTKFKQKPNEVLSVDVAINDKCIVSCGAGAHYNGEYLRKGVAPVFKTSFNCTKAASEIEKAICADKLLAEADELLASEYAKTQKKPELKDAAKSAQKKWMEKRNLECHGDKLRGCLIEKYRERILELRKSFIIAPVNAYPNDWVFDSSIFAVNQIPYGFLVKSSIYLNYGPDVLKEFESYRLDFSTEKNADHLYSIEGWILGMGSKRVLFVIDKKCIWLAFKDSDKKEKAMYQAPKGIDKSEAPDVLKKWINK